MTTQVVKGDKVKPTELESESVCLPAKAVLAQASEKTSSMQSVHHKHNVTLSTELRKIYHTHSWLLI